MTASTSLITFMIYLHHVFNLIYFNKFESAVCVCVCVCRRCSPVLEIHWSKTKQSSQWLIGSFRIQKARNWFIFIFVCFFPLSFLSPFLSIFLFKKVVTSWLARIFLLLVIEFRVKILLYLILQRVFCCVFCTIRFH